MTAKTPNLEAAMQGVLNKLDPRSRDIVTRRYGIGTGKPETLESIGREYGITRERVRQIQSQAKRVIRESQDSLRDVATLLADIFAHHGGVLSENHATELVRDRIGSDAPVTTVAFFLDVLPPYQYVTRDTFFAPHWRQSDLVSPHVARTAEVALNLLRDRQHPVLGDDLIAGVQTALTQEHITVPEDHIRAQLLASQQIQKTAFGEWGLAEWPETNPRGVGDKAYAVLRRHSRPEHFTAITDLINQAKFDHKRANAQTVHNELIKDGRFVLVGRGLYGLAEWGYIPGTVADVIESLLVQAGKPLSRDEVIERVMAQRQVKKNTILLGLQNQDRFIRTAEDNYTLRQRS